MSEVKESLSIEQTHARPELDPQVAQAGVIDVERDQQDHLDQINNHLQVAHTQVQENTPITQPHVDSVTQVIHPKQSQFTEKKPDLTIHAGEEAVWGSIRNFFSAFAHPSRFWKSSHSVTNTISVAEVHKVRGEEPFPHEAPQETVNPPLDNDSHQTPAEIPQIKEEVAHAA